MPDEIDYKTILSNELQWCIELRKKAPHDEEIPMRVSMIAFPDNQLIHTPLRWSNDAEKHRAMHALSTVCEIVDAKAAIVTSDSMTLNIEEFCKYFDLRLPTRETIRGWDKEYNRIMKPFDGTMYNLPRQLINEMIMVCAYGPRVRMMRFSDYTFADNKYTFGEMKGTEDEADVIVSMIPAWWN